MSWNYKCRPLCGPSSDADHLGVLLFCSSCFVTVWLLYSLIEYSRREINSELADFICCLRFRFSALTEFYKKLMTRNLRLMRAVEHFSSSPECGPQNQGKEKRLWPSPCHDDGKDRTVGNHLLTHSDHPMQCFCGLSEHSYNRPVVPNHPNAATL